METYTTKEVEKLLLEQRRICSDIVKISIRSNYIHKRVLEAPSPPLLIKPLKILSNEPKVVRNNEQTKKFFCFKCKTELIKDINMIDLYCPKCSA